MKRVSRETVQKAAVFVVLAVVMVIASMNFKATFQKSWSGGKKNVVGEAIKAGDVVRQDFKAVQDINKITFVVQPTGEEASANIRVQVINNTRDESVVYDEVISTSSVKRWQEWSIPVNIEGVNPEESSNGDSMTLVITGVDGTEENSIAPVIATSVSDRLELKINGKKQDGRMVITLTYFTSFNLGYYLCAILLMGAAYLLLFGKRMKNWKPQQCFLLIAVMAGTVFVSLDPPLQVPDELYHFQKSVDVSYGNLSPFVLTTNDSIYKLTGPKDIMDLEKHEIYEYTLQSDKEKGKLRGLSMDGEVKTVDSSGGFHPFIGYIPQAIGILFARLFHFNVLHALYLARFFNLLAYVFLTYFAIKWIPFGKHTLMALACTPICIAQAASVSSDAVCNGAAFLLVGLIFYYAFAYKGELGFKHMAGVAGLILVLAFVKYLYAVLAVLVFLIPKEKFGSKKKYWTTFLEIVVPLAVIFVIYYMFIGNYLVNQEPAKDGVNALEQIKYSIRHPKTLLVTYILTFDSLALTYVSQFNTLGCLNFRLGVLIVFVPLFLLYTAVTDTREPYGMNRKQKVFTGLTGIAIVLLVMYSMYMVWTPVGSMLMDGVQARYFIPALPLLLLLVRSKRITADIGNYTGKISFVSMMCLWAAVCYMVRMCY